MVAGIKDYLPDLLQEIGLARQNKKTFRCPHHYLPQNHEGYHNDSKPSATLTDDKTCFFCLACGAEGDAINLTQLYYQVDWATAVHWLHARYTLGMKDIEPPIANFDLMKYKAQYAPKYRVVAEKKAEKKRNNKQTTPINKRVKRKSYEPSFVRPAPTYTPEQYREVLIEEGDRMISAGHGVIVYHLCSDGVKRPIKAPEQPHGVKEPIRDTNKLRKVIEREIKKDKDVETKFVGIALQRLICVDIDTHHSDGLLHLSQLEAILGENLPLKHYESTISGGRHFYFHLPKDYDIIGKDALDTKVDGLLDVDGIEILSGTRGVICAPSSGYTLFDGGYVRNWFRIADLPRKWLKLLSESGASLADLIGVKKGQNKTSNSEVAI